MTNVEHPLSDVRARVYETLHFKLDHGLVRPVDLARDDDILLGLLRRLSDGQGLPEEQCQVISILEKLLRSEESLLGNSSGQLAASTSASDLLVQAGAVPRLREALTRVTPSCVPKVSQLLDVLTSASANRSLAQRRAKDGGMSASQEPFADRILQRREGKRADSGKTRSGVDASAARAISPGDGSAAGPSDAGMQQASRMSREARAMMDDLTIRLQAEGSSMLVRTLRSIVEMVLPDFGPLPFLAHKQFVTAISQLPAKYAPGSDLERMVFSTIESIFTSAISAAGARKEDATAVRMQGAESGSSLQEMLESCFCCLSEIVVSLRHEDSIPASVPAIRSVVAVIQDRLSVTTATALSTGTANTSADVVRRSSVLASVSGRLLRDILWVIESWESKALFTSRLKTCTFYVLIDVLELCVHPLVGPLLTLAAAEDVDGGGAATRTVRIDDRLCQFLLSVATDPVVMYAHPSLEPRLLAFLENHTPEAAEHPRHDHGQRPGRMAAVVSRCKRAMDLWIPFALFSNAPDEEQMTMTVMDAGNVRTAADGVPSRSDTRHSLTTMSDSDVDAVVAAVSVSSDVQMIDSLVDACLSAPLEAALAELQPSPHDGASSLSPSVAEGALSLDRALRILCMLMCSPKQTRVKAFACIAAAMEALEQQAQLTQSAVTVRLCANFLIAPDVFFVLVAHGCVEDDCRISAMSIVERVSHFLSDDAYLSLLPWSTLLQSLAVGGAASVLNRNPLLLLLERMTALAPPVEKLRILATGLTSSSASYRASCFAEMTTCLESMMASGPSLHPAIDAGRADPFAPFLTRVPAPASRRMRYSSSSSSALSSLYPPPDMKHTEAEVQALCEQVASCASSRGLGNAELWTSNTFPALLQRLLFLLQHLQQQQLLLLERISQQEPREGDVVPPSGNLLSVPAAAASFLVATVLSEGPMSLWSLTWDTVSQLLLVYPSLSPQLFSVSNPRYLKFMVVLCKTILVSAEKLQELPAVGVAGSDSDSQRLCYSVLRFLAAAFLQESVVRRRWPTSLEGIPARSLFLEQFVLSERNKQQKTSAVGPLEDDADLPQLQLASAIPMSAADPGFASMLEGNKANGQWVFRVPDAELFLDPVVRLGVARFALLNHFLRHQQQQQQQRQSGSVEVEGPDSLTRAEFAQVRDILRHDPSRILSDSDKTVDAECMHAVVAEEIALTALMQPWLVTERTSAAKDGSVTGDAGRLTNGLQEQKQKATIDHAHLIEAEAVRLCTDFSKTVTGHLRRVMDVAASGAEGRMDTSAMVSVLRLARNGLAMFVRWCGASSTTVSSLSSSRCRREAVMRCVSRIARRVCSLVSLLVRFSPSPSSAAFEETAGLWSLLARSSSPAAAAPADGLCQREMLVTALAFLSSLFAAVSSVTETTTEIPWDLSDLFSGDGRDALSMATVHSLMLMLSESPVFRKDFYLRSVACRLLSLYVIAGGGISGRETAVFVRTLLVDLGVLAPQQSAAADGSSSFPVVSRRASAVCESFAMFVACAMSGGVGSPASEDADISTTVLSLLTGGAFHPSAGLFLATASWWMLDGGTSSAGTTHLARSLVRPSVQSLPHSAFLWLDYLSVCLQVRGQGPALREEGDCHPQQQEALGLLEGALHYVVLCVKSQRHQHQQREQQPSSLLAHLPGNLEVVRSMCMRSPDVAWLSIMESEGGVDPVFQACSAVFALFLPSGDRASEMDEASPLARFLAFRASFLSGVDIALSALTASVGQDAQMAHLLLHSASFTRWLTMWLVLLSSDSGRAQLRWTLDSRLGLECRWKLLYLLTCLVGGGVSSHGQNEQQQRHRLLERNPVLVSSLLPFLFAELDHHHHAYVYCYGPGDGTLHMPAIVDPDEDIADVRRCCCKCRVTRSASGDAVFRCDSSCLECVSMTLDLIGMIGSTDNQGLGDGLARACRSDDSNRSMCRNPSEEDQLVTVYASLCTAYAHAAGPFETLLLMTAAAAAPSSSSRHPTSASAQVVLQDRAAKAWSHACLAAGLASLTAQFGCCRRAGLRQELRLSAPLPGTAEAATAVSFWTWLWMRLESARKAFAVSAADREASMEKGCAAAVGQLSSDLKIVVAMLLHGDGCVPSLPFSVDHFWRLLRFLVEASTVWSSLRGEVLLLLSGVQTVSWLFDEKGGAAAAASAVLVDGGSHGTGERAVSKGKVSRVDQIEHKRLLESLVLGLGDQLVESVHSNLEHCRAVCLLLFSLSCPAVCGPCASDGRLAVDLAFGGKVLARSRAVVPALLAKACELYQRRSLKHRVQRVVLLECVTVLSFVENILAGPISHDVKLRALLIDLVEESATAMDMDPSEVASLLLLARNLAVTGAGSKSAFCAPRFIHALVLLVHRCLFLSVGYSRPMELVHGLSRSAEAAGVRCSDSAGTLMGYSFGSVMFAIGLRVLHAFSHFIRTISFKNEKFSAAVSSLPSEAKSYLRDVVQCVKLMADMQIDPLGQPEVIPAAAAASVLARRLGRASRIAPVITGVDGIDAVPVEQAGGAAASTAIRAADAWPRSATCSELRDIYWGLCHNLPAACCSSSD